MNLSLQSQLAIRLNPVDDVAIALVPLPARRMVQVGGTSVRIKTDVPVGHKFALHALDNGAPIRRYGQVIGFAMAPIEAGEKVHRPKLYVGKKTLDHSLCAD